VTSTWTAVSSRSGRQWTCRRRASATS
jgi:hypothetical protein